MAYEYEIFLSYPRKGGVIPEWVSMHLKPMLVDLLSTELGDEVGIFQDTQSIIPGDSWPDRLRQALAHSKCLVAVWAPAYFTSEWCCREFAVMLHRSQALGYPSVSNVAGLAIPINAWDGECFPDCIRDIQQLDCRKYVRRAEYFKSTEIYMNFEEDVRQWIPHLAKTIRKAPPWNVDWTAEEWSAIPYQQLLVESVLRKPSMA